MIHDIAAGAAALALLVAPVDWPVPNPDGRASVQPEQLQQVIAQAVRDCPLLNEWKLHVVAIHYTIEHAPDYQRQLYGWRNELEIGFTLSEDTPIPPGLEGAGPVRGDVMLFDFGDGRRPGIVVNKATSRFACGLPVETSDDAFIPDPWMKRIADLHSPKPTSGSR